MAIWQVAPLRFAPAFWALGVSEHLTGHLGDIIVAEMAEIFVAQMAGDEMSLSHIRCMHACLHRRKHQLPLRSLRDLRSR